MSQEKITLACVTKPHLHRLKVLLPKVLPFVDECVLIFGEKDQESIDYVKSLGPKIRAYHYVWRDNFADSWNAYLEKIKEGWVLILDDDEIPSDALLESLRGHIESSGNGTKYSCIEFRCNPISEGQDMGPCNYFREIFFKYSPGMHYRSAHKSGCHQRLVGYQSRMIRCDDVYYHIKPLIDEYRNASRNYFIYSIWVSDQNIYQSEDWVELKKLITEHHPNVKTFPDFDKLLIENKIAEPIKKWMVFWYNKLRDHPERNEMRALTSYFMKYLHPGEAKLWGFVE